MADKIRTSDEKLGTEKIGKLIISLAVPAVMAQLINVLYNMVDRMYIGRMADVGANALTGLGLSFPIIMLISAFSAFAGAGGAPLMAIELGRGNREKAEKILGNAVSILITFSVVLTFAFMAFKEPVLYAFGASDTTIVYALEYLDIYLLGTVFVQAALGLNMFISSQGEAKTAMFSVLIGAGINIILDPIFIFGLFGLPAMGVKGAALATIMAQAVSAVWVVSFLISKKSSVRIKLKNLKPNWEIIGFIGALGVSPFIMQATESLIAVVFNSGLHKYGSDLYVGSMTVLQSVMQLVVIPVQGITQGTQPIISYNYGAKNLKRVKKCFKIVLVVTMCVTTVATIATMAAPTLFAKIFTNEAELIELVGKVLPIYMSGIWIFGMQMACQSTFMGLGQAKICLFLALLRKVILLVPMALILPKFFGVMGIYYAEPIADICSALTAGMIFISFFKRLTGEMAEE